MSETSSNCSIRSSYCQERCAVCDDVSTGYHYEVPSCNGCKSFFRRTIITKRVFQCQKRGNCPIIKDRRCMCRACRYKKCVEVGMNSNSIQTVQEKVEPSSLLYNEVIQSSMQPKKLDTYLKEHNLVNPSPLQKENLLFSSLLAIEEKIQTLRTSSLSPPSVLLDILTRPSALVTALPRSSPNPSITVSMNMEMFAVLEFVKAFSWFCNLRFSDKYALLLEKVPSLLALRLSWNRTGTYIHDQISVLLSSVIHSMRDLAVDHTTLSLLSVLLLTETHETTLSQDAKKTLSKENTMYSSSLVTYLFYKYGVSNANRVAEHFFLLLSTLKVGPIVQHFLIKTETENSLCRQIVEIVLD